MAVARDPDTAFVHWRAPETSNGARLELRWIADNDRVLRVEEVGATGRQYFEFSAPDVEHVAVLALRGEHTKEVLRSNAVVPPPSAPRVEGPERLSHPSDPNLEAIATAQERARANLPRPYGKWWRSPSSSR